MKRHVKKISVASGLLVVMSMVGWWLFRTSAPRDSDEQIDDLSQPELLMRKDEHRYPPFRDSELPSVFLIGDHADDGEKHIAVIGAVRGRNDKKSRHHDARPAIARADASGMWHPLVTEKGQHFGEYDEADDELYVAALYLEAGDQYVALGSMTDGRFSAREGVKLVALTTEEGLQYDYPGIPIIRVVE